MEATSLLARPRSGLYWVAPDGKRGPPTSFASHDRACPILSPRSSKDPGELGTSVGLVEIASTTRPESPAQRGASFNLFPSLKEGTLPGSPTPVSACKSKNQCWPYRMILMASSAENFHRHTL